MPINIGQLAATTLQNYQKTYADNIGRDVVTLNHMKANGMVQIEEGGREIVMPLEYGNSTAVGTYSGTSTINNPYQEGIDAATWDWVNYYGGVSISKDDELKNNGVKVNVSKILFTNLYIPSLTVLICNALNLGFLPLSLSVLENLDNHLF